MPPTARPAPTLRHHSRPPATLSVQVPPYLVQVRHVPGQHSLQRGTAAEWLRIVRLTHPRVRRLLVRQQHLQRLVDAQHVRDPLQHVVRQRFHALLLPLEVRRTGRAAQQPHLLLHAQGPERGDPEECPQTGLCHALGSDVRRLHVRQSHGLLLGRCRKGLFLQYSPLMDYRKSVARAGAIPMSRRKRRAPAVGGFEGGRGGL